MEPEEFASWVEHMREWRGWSKARCARELGCSPTMVYGWSIRAAPKYIKLACERLRDQKPPVREAAE